MSKRYGTIENRFHAQYIPEPNSGCWLWTGPINEGGYGKFRRNDKKVFVHRFSYELANGKFLDSQCVLHKCDNPSCVNPDHLFLGSRLDNIIDKVRKNRQCKGNHHPLAKLTEQQVLSIYNDLRPQRVIAKDYGITHRTVGQIKRGEKWRYLTNTR